MFPPEIMRAHRRLSSAAESMLAFLSDRPEGLSRAAFADLIHSDPMDAGLLQPWPMILRSELLDELAAAATRLAALIRDVPVRIFARDPEAIARHYGLSVPAAERILFDRQSSRGFVRADFVLSERGFACLELNFPPHPRGTVLSTLAAAYLRNDWFRSFAAAIDVELVHTDSLERFVHHAIACLAELDLPVDGPLNLAVEIPHTRMALSAEVARRMASAYAAELDRIGRHGRIIPIIPVARGKVRFERGRAYAGEERIGGYWSVPFLDDAIAIELERTAERRGLFLYNGPAASLFNDKRTLALLWDRCESHQFSEEDRALIQRYVPWTRRVTAELGTFLVEERERLVIKPARSFGGSGVHVGRFWDDDRWSAVVDRALSLGEWIVQEYVESLPFAGQSGERGWATNDVVWGVYLDGSEPGGTLIRCDAAGRNRGVINVRQGCEYALSLTARDP